MVATTDITAGGNGEEALLCRYLQEISPYAPLSDEQELRLSELILAGDEKAKTELVRANLKFVVSIARQYANDGAGMLDLINEGNIALMRAAEKFDARRGQRFSNYAIWSIRKAMEAFSPDSGPNVRRADVDGNYAGRTVSEGNRLDEFTEDNDYVAGVLDRLPEREQTVMKACIGLGTRQMTMREIAELYGMKRERVRQIRKRALRRINTIKKKLL